MLIITTPDTLTCTDSSTIKSAGSSIPSSLALLSPPVAAQWSPDNTSLYLATATAIQRYDPNLNSVNDIFPSSESSPITHLAAVDQSVLLYAVGTKVHSLDTNTSTKQVVASHNNEITSIALSNDLGLMATTSATTVQVINFNAGSSTTLRGLPLNGSKINASAFHSHFKTRLLLGIGKQLVIYDTARPVGPSKTITMNEASNGDINCIACSPFSKTLVACSTGGGHVGLIDLDKEKGLFRTLNVKIPITCVTFSPEGAAIYLGTATGKLLVVDLRALDKPPKAVVIGNRIEAIAVQKKNKLSSQPAPATNSEVGRRIASQSKVLNERRLKSSTKPESSSAKPSTVDRKSPPRPQTTSTPPARLSKPLSPSSSASNAKGLGRTKPLSAMDSISARSTAHRDLAKKAASSTRRPGGEMLSASRPSSASRTAASSGTRSGMKSASARPTPSPELPSVHDNSVTPLRQNAKTLNDATPEVEHWATGGKTGRMDTKGKSKCLAFEGDEPPGEENKENADDSMALQVSPQRPTASNSASWLNQGSPGGNSAREMLRGIVRDVLYEHQQETRAELTGLHLDLVRAGRGWKKELRELMNEYIGDLRDLREENKKLRDENERLRRGY